MMRSVAVCLAGSALVAASATASQTDPARDASVALDEGFHALESGDWSDATMAFRRAEGLLGSAVVYGDGRAAHEDALLTLRRGLARSHLAAGDPYTAAAEAERGLDLSEHDVELSMILAKARYRLGEIERAEAALGHARDDGADGVEYHWIAALIAVAGNDLSSARTHGRQALSLVPDATRALMLARWAEIEGDFGDAASILGDLGVDAGDPPAGARALANFYRLASEVEANRIAHETPRAQVNFDLKADDEIPFVPARLNDADDLVYVIFDTGAERNVIDASFAAAIGVSPIVDGGELRGPYRRAPAGYTVVDRIELGSVVVENVPAAVADFGALNLRSQGDYFIGAILNPAIVFRDFTVVLDYGHRRIELHRFTDGDLPYAERATRLRKTAVSFFFDANAVWPILPVSIDGARGVPFVVDTGASDILIHRATAAVLRLEPDRVLAAAGSHSQDDLGAILIDLDAASRESVGIHGILGFPFFRAKRLVLAYPDMTLVIED